MEYGVDELFYGTPWKPDPSKPAVIFVGTPTARKGIQDLIAAFAKPSLAHVELWVVGVRGFSHADQMERISSANVKWFGQVSREETARMMSRAWCLALPTRSDTSPNVVKEARVIGLPVITTPHGGQRDYIVEGENGWLVEPGDIESLSNRLSLVLGNYEETLRLGHHNQQAQREWFRPENTASAFEEVYRNLCKVRKATLS